MWTAPLNVRDLIYIVSNLREWDRREIFATRWNDDVFDLARDSLNAGDLSWVAGKENPIAAMGAFQMWPGVWQAWMYATPEFPQIGLSLTRFSVREILPRILERGAHRMECRSIEGHDDAHDWLERLGAFRESETGNFGRNGETFFTYAWTRVALTGKGQIVREVRENVFREEQCGRTGTTG